MLRTLRSPVVRSPRSVLPFLIFALIAPTFGVPAPLGPVGGLFADDGKGAKDDEDEDRPDFHAVVQTRKILEEESQIEAKGGRGVVTLEHDAKTRWIEHRVVPFEKIPDGAMVTILARRYDEVEDPDTGIETPPTYSNIQVCVIGDEFEAPELTDEQRKTKLVWARGTLTRDRAKQPHVGGTLTRIGPDRKVLHLVATKLEDLLAGRRPQLRKGTALLVTGYERGREEEPEGPVRRRREAPLRIEVVRVELVAAKFPAAEYRLIITTR